MKNIYTYESCGYKRRFYDEKNQIMDLVCEVIPCEKSCFEYLINQDEKEVYLVYSNNTDELLEGASKEQCYGKFTKDIL